MNQAMLMSLLAAKSGVPDAASLDPQALLERMGQQDPTLAAIMQMMTAQKTSAAECSPVVVEGSVDIVAEEMAELSTQLECTRAEVKQLRERCDVVAAALGACALCWGHDPGCRACRGHGAPGRCVPDENLFFEYVVPAVRLMHASRQRSNNAVSMTEAAPVRLTS